MAYKIYSRSVRFLGNNNTMEVHDLENEKTGPNECQVDEILAAGHAVGFQPDTQDQAHEEGYDDCAHCLEGSTR